eukprot:SAG11_NODE_125_length_15744_cov_50.316075_6_plen_86_part_00
MTRGSGSSAYVHWADHCTGQRSHERLAVGLLLGADSLAAELLVGRGVEAILKPAQATQSQSETATAREQHQDGLGAASHRPCSEF